MFVKMISFAIVAIVLVGCNRHSSSSRPVLSMDIRGTSWMAWDEAQREAFVSVYIDAYKTGTDDACIAIDGKLNLRKDYVPKHEKNQIVMPSGVCRVNADDYTHCEFATASGASCSFYSDTITAFYKNHPEYRQTPFEYLMRYLTDREHKSAEELYSMAKDGMMQTS